MMFFFHYCTISLLPHQLLFWVLLLHFLLLFSLRSWKYTFIDSSCQITFYLIGVFTSNWCNFVDDTSSLKGLWVVLHTIVLCPSISIYRSFILFYFLKLMCRRQVISDTGYPVLLGAITDLWICWIYLFFPRSNH